MTLYLAARPGHLPLQPLSRPPPTDWSYYDTIYTERYMRTPDANPDGYAATNLIAGSRFRAKPL